MANNTTERNAKILRVCLYAIYACTVTIFVHYAIEVFTLNSSDSYTEKYGKAVKSYQNFLYADFGVIAIVALAVRLNYQNEDPQKAKKYAIFLMLMVALTLSMLLVFCLGFMSAEYVTRTYIPIIVHALVFAAELAFFIFKKWEKVGNEHTTPRANVNTANGNQGINDPLNSSMDPHDPLSDSQINYYRAYQNYPAAGQLPPPPPVVPSAAEAPSSNKEKSSDAEDAQHPYDIEDLKETNPYL